MIDQDDDRPERGDAQPWLDMLEDAEKQLADWQAASDKIDRIYASLTSLRNMRRDREFQLFWSNIEVMAPSIYARPPVPVVTPKFKDKRPIYRVASELLERSCIVSLDLADIDQTMLELRDDLAIVGRAVAWVRYESDEDGDRVCYDHVDRKDFLHEPARKWAEVDWVASCAWLSKTEMRERFKDAADEVSYGRPRDDNGRFSNRLSDRRCGVWEIWCKSQNKVVWVTDGAPKVLDEDTPHLKLEGFFPCPRPAYATLERRSLIPVPDMLFYKDQLDEVNDLTRRIHALAEAIKVRGFYAGGGDLGEAVERAIKLEDDAQILVPVPNLQGLTQGGGAPIIWLPIEQVAKTIEGLIALRRQVFEDIYQIVGLSDIMRGMTQAEETLGAQQLKQQNGSYRVRDKQNELVRMARDLVRLGAEIMAEEFSRKTLISMAQMDLPTDAEAKKTVRDLESQAKQELEALADQAEQGHGDPQQMQEQFAQQQQQIIAKYQPQVQKASQQVTIDQVMAFLKDEKLRPFVLDIETDSTIYPDEMAEKASRAEFVGVFNQAMQTVAQAVQAGPEAIALAGGVFKFALAPYRVGRELEALIDDLVDAAPEIAERMSQQGEGEDNGLAAAQMELAKAEMAKVESQTQANQANAQLKMQELQLKAAEAQAQTEQSQQKFQLEVEKTQGMITETDARTRKVEAEILKLSVDAENQTRREDREDVKTSADIAARQTDQVMVAEQRVTSDARADRQQSFAEEQAITGGSRGS